jgi:hypothetical protein
MMASRLPAVKTKLGAPRLLILVILLYSRTGMPAAQRLNGAALDEYEDE